MNDMTHRYLVPDENLRKFDATIDLLRQGWCPYIAKRWNAARDVHEYCIYGAMCETHAWSTELQSGLAAFIRQELPDKCYSNESHKDAYGYIICSFNNEQKSSEPVIEMMERYRATLVPQEVAA